MKFQSAIWSRTHTGSVEVTQPHIDVYERGLVKLFQPVVGASSVERRCSWALYTSYLYIPGPRWCGNRPGTSTGTFRRHAGNNHFQGMREHTGKGVKAWIMWCIASYGTTSNAWRAAFAPHEARSSRHTRSHTQRPNGRLTHDTRRPSAKKRRSSCGHASQSEREGAQSIVQRP